MSLIRDLGEVEKDIARLKNKVSTQQHIYHKVIAGLVKLHQKHRVAKNYAVSDEIRELLNSVGVKIKQGTAGYKYEDIPESLKGMTVDDQWTINDGT